MTRARCTTVFVNGNVIPMTASDARATAIAVRGARIAAVGTDDEILALRAPTTDVVDLKGKTVLPGLIDSHLHAMPSGLVQSAVRLDGCRDVESVCRSLHKVARDVQPGRWVFGSSCSAWELRERRYPTIGELDAALPDHPVYLFSTTLHSGATNSRGHALIVADQRRRGNVVAPDPKAPPGSFLSDEQHFAAAATALDSLTDSDLESLFHRVAESAASRGVTTMHCLEGQFVPGDRDVRVLCALTDELPVHVLVMYQTLEVQRVLDLGLPRIGGCLTVDGASFEHTALFYEPYSDEPAIHGMLNMPEQTVREFVSEAHGAGLQIGLHAIGDRAVDMVVSAYVDAMEHWPRDDCRHRIEHFHAPTEWAVEQARRLRLALPMQPVFSYLWDRPPEDHYLRLFGRERTDRCEPFSRLCSLGVTVAGGSDSPVTPIDPLLGIHAAVNNPNAARRTGIEDALRMFTTNAAWVGFEEDDKGTIESGKLADLTVIDRDPFAEPQHIKDFVVHAAVVGGRLAYSAL